MKITKYEFGLYLFFILTAVIDLVFTFGPGLEYAEGNPLMWINDSFIFLVFVKIILITAIIYISYYGLRDGKSSELGKYGTILLLFYFIIMQGYNGYHNYQLKPEGAEVAEMMKDYQENLMELEYTPEQVETQIEYIKTEIRKKSTKWYLLFNILYIFLPWLVSITAFKFYEKISIKK